MDNLRIYGKSPFKVAVIHGGPGATGEMAPLAHQLSSKRGVLEPLQTRDGDGAWFCVNFMVHGSPLTRINSMASRLVL